MKVRSFKKQLKVLNVNEEIKVIADEVMAYLKQNPHSSDTLDGIMRWWIRESCYSSGAVLSALNELIDKGKLSKLKRANGTEYYTRCNDSN